jgi:hypothetical protein
MVGNRKIEWEMERDNIKVNLRETEWNGLNCLTTVTSIWNFFYKLSNYKLSKKKKYSVLRS